MPRQAEGGVSSASWNSEQIRNAQIIIQVGRALGASERDIQIALATAMQESSLLNVGYGTGSSIGLFQQTAPWGTREQRHDPYQAARMFFLGGHGAGQPGLLDNHWRQHQTLTEAAQWVQRSAYPNAYAKWAAQSSFVLNHYGDNIRGAHFATTARNVSAGAPSTPLQPTAKPKEPDQTPDLFTPVSTPEGADVSGMMPPEIFTDWEPGRFDLPGGAGHQIQGMLAGLRGGRGSSVGGAGGIRGRIVAQAMTRLGEPYVWGALDCSGLVQQTFAALGYHLPRVSFAQANSGKRTSISNLQPGDLVAWDNSSRNNGADHIAIYAGNGYIIEAPRTGLNVRKRKLGSHEGSMWGVSLAGLLG
jgi:cell wall-associated NlpC family hydrolase